MNPAIERFTAAFDAQDVDAIMAAMTPDCVFEDTAPPDGRRHVGTEAVRAAWTALFAAQPAGAFSTDAGRNTRTGTQLGLAPARVYASFEAMIAGESALPADIRAQAVAVVTPNHLHAPMAIAALDAGFDVLCEKPMAVSSTECETMIAACRAAGRKLMIGYRSHFEPHNIEAMRLARTGAIHVETERFTLDEAPEAYRRLHEGTLRGRAVVVP